MSVENFPTDIYCWGAVYIVGKLVKQCHEYKFRLKSEDSNYSSMY